MMLRGVKFMSFCSWVASRTPGIRTEPPPRVLQRELSDFYVQYHLLAHLEDGQNRAAVLSDLHAQIQDAFNEYGVQIMSPHFESQPKKPVVVPKSAWYAPPVSSPASGIDGREPAAKSEARVSESRENVSAAPPRQTQSAVSRSKKRTQAACASLEIPGRSHRRSSGVRIRSPLDFESD